jgi:hypothetical protein
MDEIIETYDNTPEDIPETIENNIISKKNTEYRKLNLIKARKQRTINKLLREEEDNKLYEEHILYKQIEEVDKELELKKNLLYLQKQKKEIEEVDKLLERGNKKKEEVKPNILNNSINNRFCRFAN